MAQKTVITLIDDLNGTVIEEGKGETISFSLDGINYQIDLTSDNAEGLREALRPYLAKARKVTRPTAVRSTSGARPKQDLSAVRTWLREQGHKVSERGRIPATLLEEYRTNSGM